MLPVRGPHRPEVPIGIHHPIRAITVEREYGSHGGEFAHDLACRLGWRLLDSELVAGAARMAGVDSKLAARYDERLDPWYYRYGKILWQDPIYAPAPSQDRTFDAERMMELIRKEMLNAAAEGNCVIVGRGGACALMGHPSCFHVFVYASPKARRDWYMQAFPDQAQHADAHLAAFDKRRAAIIKKFYDQNWCARGLYHLLLNSCMGIEAMIAAVQGAAGLSPASVPAQGAS